MTALFHKGRIRALRARMCRPAYLFPASTRGFSFVARFYNLPNSERKAYTCPSREISRLSFGASIMADEITPGEAGKALGKLGASKGGRARAEKLSPERRKEIAQKAIQARWAKAKGGAPPGEIPKAEHTGTLKIGDIELPCAVLDDGTRVFTQSGFLTALGRSERPAGLREENVEQMPPFLVAKNLKPFISKELIESSKPIPFRPKLAGSTEGSAAAHGGIALGYKVELLPLVCQVYLDAREAKGIDAGQAARSNEDCGTVLHPESRPVAGRNRGAGR